MKKLYICLFFLFINFFSFAQSEYQKQSYRFQNIPAEQALEEIRKSDFLSRIKVEKLSDFEKVKAGRAFKNKASAKFSILENNNYSALSNIDILVSYPIQDGTSSKIEYTMVKTDEDGVASFSLEAFHYPLLSEVKFIPKLLNNTDSVPLEFEAFDREEYPNLLVSFPCKVAANKKRGLRASIDIADFDENGRAYGRNRVATSFLGELMKRGYFGHGNYSSSVMRNPNRNSEDVLPQAKKDFAGNVKDFIFGRTKISKLEKKEDKWEATCEGKIKIWNMKTDTLAKEIFCSSIASGNSKNEAELKARQNLGSKVLGDIIEYGFEFQ